MAAGEAAVRCNHPRVNFGQALCQCVKFVRVHWHTISNQSGEAERSTHVLNPKP